jgi:hypothetical protein
MKIGRGRFKDLTGQRFGRLRVLAFRGRSRGYSAWLSLCDCGRRTVVAGGHLRNGHTKSCGCFRTDFSRNTFTKHGMRGSREYAIWNAMKTRCTNPNSIGWKYYGGRGIKVCRRWSRSFAAFYDDMGPCPRGRSLDRKNNNGNYTPQNCRWATPQMQRGNRRLR